MDPKMLQNQLTHTCFPLLLTPFAAVRIHSMEDIFQLILLQQHINKEGVGMREDKTIEHILVQGTKGGEHFCETCCQRDAGYQLLNLTFTNLRENLQ